LRKQLFPSLAFYTSAIAAGFVAGFVAVGGLALPTNQALLLLLLFLLVHLLPLQACELLCWYSY
jgi:hypothetical protein